MFVLCFWKLVSWTPLEGTRLHNKWSMSFACHISFKPQKSKMIMRKSLRFETACWMHSKITRTCNRKWLLKKLMMPKCSWRSRNSKKIWKTLGRHCRWVALMFFAATMKYEMQLEHSVCIFSHSFRGTQQLSKDCVWLPCIIQGPLGPDPLPCCEAERDRIRKLQHLQREVVGASVIAWFFLLHHRTLQLLRSRHGPSW